MRLKKTSQTTDLVLALFLYIPVVWAALLIAQSLGGGLPELLSNLTAALEQPFQIQWTDKSLLSILVCTGAYLMGLCLYASGQGRTRDGEEHGSAAWGSPRQLNAQFRQKQNKILTRHVRLGLDTHKHRRSLNVLVIGGSGAAKTRGYVKPNILEANSNYVITDPKMEVLTATGGYLKRQGYDIRVLNLVDLSQSDGYNPFRYVDPCLRGDLCGAHSGDRHRRRSHRGDLGLYRLYGASVLHADENRDDLQKHLQRPLRKER